MCSLILVSLSMFFCTAATSAPIPKRPLVFIPGILGSKLVKGGETLWGSDAIASLRNFLRLELKDKKIVVCDVGGGAR
jgi:hypothetical protein